MNRRVALLFLSALAACASGEAFQAASPPNGDPSCNTESECAFGFACTNGRCQRAGDMPDTLDVQITPPLSSGYVPTQLLEQRIGVDRDLDLVLPRATEHKVFVYDDAFTTPRAIGARVTFKGVERIPRRETDLIAEILEDAQSNTHAVRLLQGEYVVSIARNDGYPSLRTRFTVREPTPAPTQKDFRFKLGRHIHGEVSSSLASDRKLAGIEVTAYSTETGLASTTTITDAFGRYSVELPNTTDTAFRLVAAPPQEQQPAWGYEEVVMVENRDDANRLKDIPIEPTSDMIQGAALIQFGSESPEGFVPAVDTNVTLTALSEGGLSTRSYRVTGTTNREGYLELHDENGPRDLVLLKGQYLAEVSPPPGSRVSRTMTSTTIDLSSVSPSIIPNIQVTLPLRTAVTATVRSDLGRPVVMADVQLISTELDILPFRAKTDAGGAFSVNVDAGAYVLVIAPNSETDLREVVPTSARTLDVYQVETQDLGSITMPASAVVRGSVRGMIDFSSVPNSKVEVFQRISGRAVSISSAYSELDGTFDLTLPR